MRARASHVAGLSFAVAFGIFALFPGQESEARAKMRDFVVAGGDGYGTQACLAEQSSCGRIVADAWCESKGFKAALAYRKLDADEITGSTHALGTKPVDSFLISCRE
jgi:hypothetical protein